MDGFFRKKKRKRRKYDLCFYASVDFTDIKISRDLHARTPAAKFASKLKKVSLVAINPLSPLSLTSIYI